MENGIPKIKKSLPETIKCGAYKPTFQYITQAEKDNEVIVKADDCGSMYLYEFRYNMYQKLSEDKLATSLSAENDVEIK